MSTNYLQDPERARAYAHLIEHPYGTLRTWATAIGWTTGKMQRFLASLSRYRLGEITADKHGTSFTPRDPKVHRLASACTDVHRCASAPYLGTGSGLTGSRYGGTPPDLKGDGATAPSPAVAGAELMIAALNEEMRYKFGDSYAPIRSDHRGSHKAAERIAAAGIPIEDAVQLVRERARQYTPDRTGGLPHSLGHPYLAKGAIDEWRRRERDRQQLPLLPQLDMAIERSAPVAQAVGSTMLPREPDRTRGDPAVIDAGAQEWRAIANSDNRPQRMK